MTARYLIFWQVSTFFFKCKVGIWRSLLIRAIKQGGTLEPKLGDTTNDKVFGVFMNHGEAVSNKAQLEKAIP